MKLHVECSASLLSNCRVDGCCVASLFCPVEINFLLCCLEPDMLLLRPLSLLCLIHCSMLPLYPCRCYTSLPRCGHLVEGDSVGVEPVVLYDFGKHVVKVIIIEFVDEQPCC
ncbi:hypothetical protein VNO80_22033 [Phaseolus coccineus]|uniref:Uncharacterized protein n=1 Tax=Phaseolus coccineus TaxID=3886 RepID=A0AAN9M4Y2_PHACN